MFLKKPLTLLVVLFAGAASAEPVVTTFSIVAADPDNGEVGIAVASRFFSVGSVVPYATGGIGAVATQANANVRFGPRGLELLASGKAPAEVVTLLLQDEATDNGRQFGIVGADGRAATYTGSACQPWAGGRAGPNYAVQGNLLAGEAVIIEMERAFLNTSGTLADRLFAALLAGEAAGGDARGKQSAALIVRKPGTGFGGGNDRAIDIRVDDHAEPFEELGRLLEYANMNYAWNEAWTAYVKQDFNAALAPMERTAALAPDIAEVHYDLALIRLANDDAEGALDALTKALRLNPKLKVQAKADNDLSGLRGDRRFEALLAN